LDYICIIIFRNTRLNLLVTWSFTVVEDGLKIDQENGGVGTNDQENDEVETNDQENDRVGKDLKKGSSVFLQNFQKNYEMFTTIWPQRRIFILIALKVMKKRRIILNQTQLLKKKQRSKGVCYVMLCFFFF
jgi:hypothetical protein